MSFKQRIKRMSSQYQRFVEKQGFPIIMTLCVAIIVLSAVWSGKMDTMPPVPTPPVDQAQSASLLQQQSLADITTAPTATTAPVSWQLPLEKLSVLRGFQHTRMTPSAVSGIWQVHDAVDLQAQYGAPVSAIADGKVTACCEEGILGVAVTVDHGNGYIATYANLSAIAALRTGDPVRKGQVIGFAGDSMLDEETLEPHLHLQILHDGLAVDPLLLFNK